MRSSPAKPLRPAADAGPLEELLRQRSQPPGRRRWCLARTAHRFLAYASVADVDEAVGDRRRSGVVADDHDRTALPRRELADRLVDEARVPLVQLSGRLVGEEEPRPVGKRCAESDALLLAARE
jgi:hypothetical protein